MSASALASAPAPARTRHLVLGAVAIHLLARLVSAVYLVRASDLQTPFPPWTDEDPDYFDMSTLWDGTWYRIIAEDGYPAELPTDAAGNLQQNAWAFYPAFPLTARLVMTVTGGSFAVVASTLALVAGVAAAGIMAVVLARSVRPALALAAVAVWSVYPASPALQIAYTESFAMLVLCGWLLALQRERWVAVGILSIAVGLTRPIAVPLGLVLLVVLALRWRARRDRPWAMGDRWRALLALALTGVGGFLWPTIVGLATGRADAYTATMATWRASGTIEPFQPWVDMSRWYFQGSPNAEWLAPLSLVVIAVVLLALVLGPWAAGLGVELRAWCLAYPAYLAAVLDPFTSTFRYVIPLFPLAAILVGGGLRSRSRGVLAGGLVVAALLVAVSIRFQWTWITELLVFHPPSDYPP